MNYAHYHPRRTHRKRFSALTLSSDTIQTLPEYSFPPSSAWSSRQPSSAIIEDPPSDRPPDYPDSAEEGDADTDESEANVVYVPQAHSSSLQASPKRARRLHSRKKAHSVSDPYLDSLLERSVHALEMSNALLQTSISTQSSLSTILDPENATERLLETHALRIKGNRTVHENWMDDLEEISKGVEGLFRDGEQPGNDENSSAVSRSLPTSTMSDLSHRRRRSLDLRKAIYEAPQLQLSRLGRTDLIAPAPRAVTLYVASTTDPELITLPSTLGLRASASSHSSEGLSRRMSAASSQQDLRSSQSLPHLPGQASDHTPAYNLLSTLAKRSGSATPPPAMASPRGFSFRPRRGSNSTTSTERGSKFSRSPPTLRMLQSSPDGSNLSRRSRSVTPKPLTSPTIPRQMTPPIEELSASSSSSSTSSSGHPTGYRTVQSLRKILDEQPSSLSLPNSASSKGKPKHLRAPSFFPRSPPPAPSSGTSTATASVSRLFTKSRHSSSTRPPSPPAHSSLKVRSVPPTPAPSPTTLSLPEIFGNGVAKALGSTPSSGVSTPKRISFAELPESYAKSRPEGAPSKFSDKKARSKSRKSKGKGKGGGGHGDKDSSDSGGWFSGWLLGGAATGMTVSKQEDRMARSWGNRPGFGTLDDWAV